LLEDFFDISNTQAGKSPGHMNIYPFGQTFVDPAPRELVAFSGQFLGQVPAPPPSARPTAGLVGFWIGALTYETAPRTEDWTPWRFVANFTTTRAGTTSTWGLWLRTRRTTSSVGVIGLGIVGTREISEEREWFQAECPYDPRFDAEMRRNARQCLPPGEYIVPPFNERQVFPDRRGRTGAW